MQTTTNTPRLAAIGLVSAALLFLNFSALVAQSPMGQRSLRSSPQYQGPSGGGTPQYAGPQGGGSPGNPPSTNPSQPQSGGTTPQEPPPGVTPGPGVPPVGIPSGGPGQPAGSPVPAPPVGPLPPHGGAPGNPRAARGGTTPAGLPFANDRWENWWLVNRDRYLDVTQTFTARAKSSEISSDEFLGTVVDPAHAAPIPLHRPEVRAKILPLLEKLLRDENAIVRGEAALALGKIGGNEVLPVLRSAVSDTNRYVRQLALLGIGLTGDREAVPFLASYILRNSEQDLDRAFAALGLALLGDEQAIPALATIIGRESVQRNLTAASIYALGFIPGETTTLILRTYVDRLGNPGDLRAVATLALGKQETGEVAPRLLKLLQDQETHVRRSATLALGQLSYRSPLWERRDELLERMNTWNAMKTLTPEAHRALEGHLADLEQRAAEQTRRLQDLQRRAVTVLAHTLDRDSDRMVRYFATMALGRIGSPEARLELTRAWRKFSGSEPARGFVALALGISGGPEALPLLRRALAQRGLDPSSRSAVYLALGLLRDRASFDELLAVATSESNPEMRGNAAVAVGLIGLRAAREPLRSELNAEARTFLRPVYGLALAMLGDWEVLQKLASLILDPSASTTTRVEATQAMSWIHDLGSIDVLLKILGGKATDVARASAVHAIGQIAEKSLLPGLEPLARDWDYLLPFPVINDAILR